MQADNYTPKAYIGTDTTGPFGTEWTFWSADDLLVRQEVIATGAFTTLVLNTDYTVTGGLGSSGTVTTDTAVPDTDRLWIERREPATQTKGWANQRSVDTTEIEKADDKLTRLVQVLYEITGRCFKADVNGPTITWDDIAEAVAAAAASASAASTSADNASLAEVAAVVAQGLAEGARDAAEAAQAAAEAVDVSLAANLAAAEAAVAAAGASVIADIQAAAPGAATTSSQGLVELATPTEAVDGLDDTRAVTPAGLAAALKIRKAYTSSLQVITTAGQLTLAHGLGAIPAIVQAQLVCQVAGFGYSVGDVVCVDLTGSAGNSTGMSVVATASSLVVRYGSHPGGAFYIIDAATGAGYTANNSSWKVRILAFA